MSIGKNIKRIRKEQKLTQKELAEKSGISEISIRQYENDKRNPKIEQVDKIAKALNVYISEIMNDYTFDEYKKTFEFREKLEYESSEWAIIAILTEIYDEFKERRLELRPGILKPYYFVRDGEKTFCLDGFSIYEIHSYLYETLPLLINMMKGKTTEKDIIDRALKSDLFFPDKKTEDTPE